jgi:hypothetical protein
MAVARVCPPIWGMRPSALLQSMCAALGRLAGVVRDRAGDVFAIAMELSDGTLEALQTARGLGSAAPGLSPDQVRRVGARAGVGAGAGAGAGATAGG